MRTRVRVPLLLFLGSLLLQVVWMLIVPAFRGVDEFDHAYRAASVARGEWLPSRQQAPDGRGELVTVPRDIVAAAGPECRTRAYTEHDNCAPVGDSPDDPVRVATAASRYHPAFYWLIGTPARAFDGTAALYAMRASAAVLCSLFVALAGWTTAQWARTVWPMAALVLMLKPVVVYSGSLPAPNGIEMMAAVSVWCAVAGLASRGQSVRTRRLLLWSVVPGGLVLASVRSLGVLWLAACLVTGLVLIARRDTPWFVPQQPRAVAAVAAVLGAGVLASLAWILWAGPNRLEEHADNPGAVLGSLVQVPVWVLQSVATGVGRADPAPITVYLLCGAVLVSFLCQALRGAGGRLRATMLALAVASVAGPFVLTLLTYRDVGVVWQGRYGVPFSAGVVVLAGLALDRGRPVTGRWARPGLLVGVVAYAGGHLIAAVAVLHDQRAESPSVALGLWSPPGAWVVVLVTVVGWALLAVVVLRRPSAGSQA